jgi:pyruvate/2-oxoglutarate dehydrogenase complex dihydrolipoamide acyltransferase (E2) component
MTPAREPAPSPAMPIPPARPPKAELEARLRRIAAEQGTTYSAAAERVLGSGEHLWATDAELDEFLEAIRRARHGG